MTPNDLGEIYAKLTWNLINGHQKTLALYGDKCMHT